MRNASLNFLFALLLLVIISCQADSCLGNINATLGATPSFFNMSDPANQGISNMNISAAEKFYLLVHSAFSEAPLLPSIRNYNLLMPFSCPPNGTQNMDGKYIYNAWVRAITVMPSVTDGDGNRWALPNGEVLAAHNYSVRLPRSATNVYPDCGVVYTLLNSSARLSVYANGNYLGNSDLTSYGINSTNLNATAQLSVSASVRRDYYESYCYCCKSSKEGCEETCCYCKFSSSDVDTDQANPRSSIDRKVYNFEAVPNITMRQCPNGSTSAASGNLSLNTSVPVQAVSISFGEASSTVYAYGLDIMTILEPHNALEARSFDLCSHSPQTFISGYSISPNLILVNFTGIRPEYVKSPYAGIIVADLFGIQHNLTSRASITCPINPQIKLTIPWLVENGSNFQALVTLSEGGRGIPNKKVNLYYSGEEFTGATNSAGEVGFNLKANQSIVKVESDYDGKYAEASAVDILVVYEQSIITYLLSLLALLFILALSYIAVRLVGGGL